MVFKVDVNLMKLTLPAFMHVQVAHPHQVVKKGDRFICYTKHGQMGDCEVREHYVNELISLQPAAMYASDGNLDFIERMANERKANRQPLLNNRAPIWITVFAFTKRNDALFKRLLLEESERLNLSFIEQTSLFV